MDADVSLSWLMSLKVAALKQSGHLDAPTADALIARAQTIINAI